MSQFILSLPQAHVVHTPQLLLRQFNSTMNTYRTEALNVSNELANIKDFK